MKRNALLTAGLFLLVLSFYSTAWGWPAYSSTIWRNVGNGYTIRVYGNMSSPDLFHAIDVLRVKGGCDQPSLLVVSYCVVPEYQTNSKFVFLRMKLPPPELATVYDDFDERRAAFDEEYRFEYNKWFEELKPFGSATGCEKFNESMKPFNDKRDSFWKELGRIQEAALPEMQLQDCSYYIIDKTKETVIGPLSEQAFLASKAVNGKKIHWKPAPKTFEEYSRGLNATVIFIVCLWYSPWFILSLVIIAFVYSFSKRKKRARLKEK